MKTQLKSICLDNSTNKSEFLMWYFGRTVNRLSPNSNDEQSRSI